MYSPANTFREGNAQAGGEPCYGQNIIKTPSSHQQGGDSLNNNKQHCWNIRRTSQNINGKSQIHKSITIKSYWVPLVREKVLWVLKEGLEGALGVIEKVPMVTKGELELLHAFHVLKGF